MQSDSRLYYVDWLRVSAFALLILYHSSVAFFPDMNWLLKSAETSETLSLVMDFPRAWRLALLFFVSGMGTWFAFRSSERAGFPEGAFPAPVRAADLCDVRHRRAAGLVRAHGRRTAMTAR